MCPKILNSVGLILSIIGSIFWFVWGLSRNVESFQIELEDNDIVETKCGKMTVKEAKRRDEAEIADCGKLARLGMFLIGLGFVFQLIAAWI